MSTRDPIWRDTGKGYKTRKIKGKKVSNPSKKSPKVHLKAAQNLKKSAARAK